MAATFMQMDAAGYEIAYKHFISQLVAFHEARSGPFKGRPPLLAGRAIDLYYLYQKVISMGGFATVNTKNRWPEVIRCFDLPSSCTNAMYAVRQYYSRFLESYERVNFLGEDDRDLWPVDEGPSSHSGHGDDQSVRHNIRASLAERRSSAAAAAATLSRTPAASVGTASNFGSSTVELRHLRLSLRCGFANEAQLALNACLIMSHKSPDKLAFSRMPELVMYLLAHAGFYHEDIMPEVKERWNEEHCRRLSAFWQNTVDSVAQPLLAPTHCFRSASFPDSLGYSGRHDWAVRQVELVATLLRNCADHEPNARCLVSSELFSCFSAAMLCCAAPQVRHIGEELAVVCGEYFLLDKGIPQLMSPTRQHESMLMAQPHRLASRRHAWQSIVFDMVMSCDRMSVVRGLQLISSLCKANDDASMAAQLPAPCLRQVYALLSALDVQLLLSALEALLSLASQGTFCARVLCSRPGGIRQLVSLLTLDVEQSMPKSALDGIVLVGEEVDRPLLQRTDGEGIAKAWLLAFYETRIESVCSRNQVYNEYAMHCAVKVQPSVALLQPSQFWLCMAAVYPRLQGMGLTLPGSTAIADMHLRGLRQRASPLTLRFAPPAPGVHVMSSIVIQPRPAQSTATRASGSVVLQAPARVTATLGAASASATSASSTRPVCSQAASAGPRSTSQSAAITSAAQSLALATRPAILAPARPHSTTAVRASTLAAKSLTAMGIAKSLTPNKGASLSANRLPGSSPSGNTAATNKRTQPVSSGTGANATTVKSPVASSSAPPANAIATATLAQLYQQRQQERLKKASTATLPSQPNVTTQVPVNSHVAALAATTTPTARPVSAAAAAPSATATVTQTTGQVTQAAVTVCDRTTTQSSVPAAVQSTKTAITTAVCVTTSTPGALPSTATGVRCNGQSAATSSSVFHATAPSSTPKAIVVSPAVTAVVEPAAAAPLVPTSSVSATAGDAGITTSPVPATAADVTTSVSATAAPAAVTTSPASSGVGIITNAAAVTTSPVPATVVSSLASTSSTPSSAGVLVIASPSSIVAVASSSSTTAGQTTVAGTMTSVAKLVTHTTATTTDGRDVPESGIASAPGSSSATQAVAPLVSNSNTLCTSPETAVSDSSPRSAPLSSEVSTSTACPASKDTGPCISPDTTACSSDVPAVCRGPPAISSDARTVAVSPPAVTFAMPTAAATAASGELSSSSPPVPSSNSERASRETTPVSAVSATATPPPLSSESPGISSTAVTPPAQAMLQQLGLVDSREPGNGTCAITATKRPHDSSETSDSVAKRACSNPPPVLSALTPGTAADPISTPRSLAEKVDSAGQNGRHFESSYARCTTAPSQDASSGVKLVNGHSSTLSNGSSGSSASTSPLSSQTQTAEPTKKLTKVNGLCEITEEVRAKTILLASNLPAAAADSIPIDPRPATETNVPISPAAPGGLSSQKSESRHVDAATTGSNEVSMDCGSSVCPTAEPSPEPAAAPSAAATQQQLSCSPSSPNGHTHSTEEQPDAVPMDCENGPSNSATVLSSSSPSDSKEKPTDRAPTTQLLSEELAGAAQPVVLALPSTPPKSPETSEITPEPSWKHRCLMTTCTFGCDDALDLRRHLVARHMSAEISSPAVCQWQGCTSTVTRPPINLKCHTLEHILSLETEPRRFSSPGVSTVENIRLEPVSLLTSEPTEYALTGTVRLTAALVLLNLVRNCSSVRARLRPYEQKFVSLAAVESEASPTLAKCLAELCDDC
eukprot:scpid37627/ scgid22823/ AT-rich interactive domain-containing protein 2; BRG1-associated factor 200; Zinc finger protein with activation potential; Zipzap/p200